MPINFPTTGLTPGVTTYTYLSSTWLWTGTVWQSVGTAQGLQGTQGIQGRSVQGIQGQAGSVQGIQGIQGIQGGGFNQLQGTIGAQGIQGIQGGVGSSILGSSNTFTANNTITPSTSVVPLTINQPASAKGLIVKGNATGDNIQEWQNSSGTPLISISSDGYINKAGTVYIGPQLNFANPGVGNDTRFTFTKSNDQAWLSVVETSNDSTYYEFGMNDNPTAGDYFQWRWDNYEAPAQGWMPIQIGAMATRFTSAVSNWGSFSIPTNTSFATLNQAATSSTSYVINKYAPTNNTAYSLNKDSGTGTGTVTLDATSFTGSSRTGYWISIDAGGTTFTWGNGYTNNAAVGTGVTITGSVQTLNNGVKVTLSTTGHVSGDKWSFMCFPTPTIAIGGNPTLTSMQTIFPSAGVNGLVIKAASSQTADLQQWQNSSGTVLASISSSGTATLTNPIINNFVLGYSTTVTAAGTTTLTNTSNNQQLFTGTTTQTLVMPVASTMTVGTRYVIENNSTGVITVQSSGLNTIATIPGGISIKITCILASGTDATSWDYEYVGFGAVTGTGSSVLATAPTISNLNATGTLTAATISASASVLINGKDIELMTIMGAF